MFLFGVIFYLSIYLCLEIVLTILLRRHLVFRSNQILIDEYSIVLTMIIVAMAKTALKVKMKCQLPEPMDSSASADQACSEQAKPCTEHILTLLVVKL